jgi:hypothetical protein
MLREKSSKYRVPCESRDNGNMMKTRVSSRLWREQQHCRAETWRSTPTSSYFITHTLNRCVTTRWIQNSFCTFNDTIHKLRSCHLSGLSCQFTAVCLADIYAALYRITTKHLSQLRANRVTGRRSHNRRCYSIWRTRAVFIQHNKKRSLTLGVRKTPR